MIRWCVFHLVILNSNPIVENRNPIIAGAIRLPCKICSSFSLVRLPFNSLQTYPEWGSIAQISSSSSSSLVSSNFQFKPNFKFKTRKPLFSCHAHEPHFLIIIIWMGGGERNSHTIKEFQLAEVGKNRILNSISFTDKQKEKKVAAYVFFRWKILQWRRRNRLLLARNENLFHIRKFKSNQLPLTDTQTISLTVMVCRQAKIKDCDATVNRHEIVT